MAECGLVNLGSCLTQKIFEFIIGIVNSPIQPFLQMNVNLLSTPVDLSIFFSLWTIIVYMLSMFYAFLIMYSGFNFIVSGYDSAKRENAKNWLRNVVIMIVLIQASYFIYQLIIGLSASLTNATLTLIDPSFYLLGTGGMTDIGLSLVFGILYLITLIITAFVLVLRYALVALGVVLFPIAIFLYFIPALRPYGAVIINFLGTSIFITFIDAIILIGFSKIVNVGVFGDMKVIVLISAFSLINILMFFMMFFSIIKSAINTGTKIASFVAKVTA